MCFIEPLLSVTVTGVIHQGDIDSFDRVNDTGNPVPNAKISFTAIDGNLYPLDSLGFITNPQLTGPTFTTTSDKNGAYTIDLPSPNNYFLQLLTDGFLELNRMCVGQTSLLTLEHVPTAPIPGNPGLLLISFSSSTPSISGRVSTAQNRPVKGAVVSLIQNGTNVTSVITDKNGKYTFSNVAPDKYELIVGDANFLTDSAIITKKMLKTEIKVKANFKLKRLPSASDEKVGKFLIIKQH